jgi:hypothetical protein
MSERTYIGIDNGVTGTYGIIHCIDGVKQKAIFSNTPVIEEQSYTKKKQNIKRLDWKKFGGILKEWKDHNPYIIIEQPYVNATDPRMVKTIISGHRFLEALIITIEWLNIPYRYITSREWQKMLITGTKIPYAKEWKILSTQLGIREFPEFADTKAPDFDGIWIAEWARRSNL